MRPSIAVASFADLPDEQLRALGAKARLVSDIGTSRAGYQVVDEGRILNYDVCPPPHNVRSNQDGYGAAVSCDRDLLALLDSRQQVGQGGTGLRHRHRDHSLIVRCCTSMYRAGECIRK